MAMNDNIIATPEDVARLDYLHRFTLEFLTRHEDPKIRHAAQTRLIEVNQEWVAKYIADRVSFLFENNYDVLTLHELEEGAIKKLIMLLDNPDYRVRMWAGYQLLVREHMDMLDKNECARLDAFNKTTEGCEIRTRFKYLDIAT